MWGKAQAVAASMSSCSADGQVQGARNKRGGERGRGHEHAFQKAKDEASGVLKPFDTELLRAQHHTSHLGWWEAVQFMTLSEQTWAG